MAILIHPNLPGPCDVRAFKGTAGQIAAVGIVKYEDAANVAPDLFKFGSSFLNLGQLAYRRQRWKGDFSGLEGFGPWEPYAGDYESLRGALQFVAQARVPEPAAGQPMVTPSGLDIVDSLGQDVLQPGQGQPMRDQWTGKVLVPEVLVP